MAPCGGAREHAPEAPVPLQPDEPDARADIGDMDVEGKQFDEDVAEDTLVERPFDTATSREEAPAEVRVVSRGVEPMTAPLGQRPRKIKMDSRPATRCGKMQSDSMETKEEMTRLKAQLVESSSQVTRLDPGDRALGARRSQSP